MECNMCGGETTNPGFHTSDHRDDDRQMPHCEKCASHTRTDDNGRVLLDGWYGNFPVVK